MRVALLPRLATVCAVVVIAAGCADDRATTSAPTPAASTVAPTSTTTATTTGGDGAPTSITTPADTATTNMPGATLPASYDWEAPLIGGGSISLRNLGDRDVLLWFWAPY